MKSNLSVGVIGLWHLGSVYAAGLAKLGFSVAGFDQDKKTVAQLARGKPPVSEPELEKTISAHLHKNLDFTSQPKRFFEDKDYVFITYDLPVDEHDHVMTSPIDRVTTLIKGYGKAQTVFVVSSQVPLGTCRKIQEATGRKLIYFPENVRLGQALETFLHPDRIILGADDSKILTKFVKDFAVFNCDFMRMGLESAEMVKHTLNSYLATCISFSSEMADLCELLGANMNDVVAALKTDRRVSPFAPINPGLGFAGATLGRDVQGLKSLGTRKKYQTKLLNSVYAVNRGRLPWLLKKVARVKPDLKGLTVGVLGLTYKPGTNTLRRSLSLELLRLLHKKGCQLRAYDPVITKAIPRWKFVKIAKNYDEFFRGLNLTILMTEWPEFKEIPVRAIARLMKERIFFDTKNFLDSDMFRKNNFIFKGTGI